MTGTEFNETVSKYKKDPESYQSEIREVFSILIDQLTELFPRLIFRCHIKSIRDDLISLGLEKISKFDEEKGKAFNYFTTVLLGHARQTFIERNYVQFSLGKEKTAVP